MPAQLALLGCVLFILWLFATDRVWHGRVSGAMWLPLVWLVVLGSRPISMWFGLGREFATTGDYVEGSPFDRMVFSLLIFFALIVLVRRRVNWALFFRTNKWLCIFFLYLGLSTLWSDYPFVSFKRWIKDAGNILMVLIILTEEDPVDAVKVLLGRCAFLLIPLSVLLVKYFPEIGRAYNQWPPYNPINVGVTTDKNVLGMTLFVSGLSISWIALSIWTKASGPKSKAGMSGLLLLLLMTFWLLFKAQSSTAFASTILGVGAILALQIHAVRGNIKRVEGYGIAIVVLMLLLHLTFNLGGLLVTALGRDLTFTGRTEIWVAVLNEDINPLIGTGYYSFWLGDRVERLSEAYFYHLNEAHNGFIETYLNSGVIGLFLLAMFVVSAYRNIRAAIIAGSDFGYLRLVFLMVTLTYNITEATFNRLNLIWFMLLLISIEYPKRQKAKKEQGDRKVPSTLRPRLSRVQEVRPEVKLDGSRTAQRGKGRIHENNNADGLVAP